MAVGIDLELRLEGREQDRVFVSVVLSPSGEDAGALDGVSVQLYSRTKRALSARLLLPIAGKLIQPMVSTVELRALEPIPAGSFVQGTAWKGSEQRDATCPTDPGTAFADHMRGRRRLVPEESDLALAVLVPEERAVFSELYPWVDEPMIPVVPLAELSVVDQEEDDEDDLDALCAELGLDDEAAGWVKELMEE